MNLYAEMDLYNCAYHRIHSKTVPGHWVHTYSTMSISPPNLQYSNTHLENSTNLWDLNQNYEEGHQLGLEEGRQRGLEEGIEKGIEQGIERGIEKGIEKEKTITARKLKSLNISVDTIMQVTGLSAEEIEKL